jgi:hypothetical protein
MDTWYLFIGTGEKLISVQSNFADQAGCPALGSGFLVHKTITARCERVTMVLHKTINTRCERVSILLHKNINARYRGASQIGDA